MMAKKATTVTIPPADLESLEEAVKRGLVGVAAAGEVDDASQVYVAAVCKEGEVDDVLGHMPILVRSQLWWDCVHAHLERLMEVGLAKREGDGLVGTRSEILHAASLVPLTIEIDAEVVTMRLNYSIDAVIKIAKEMKETGRTGFGILKTQADGRANTLIGPVASESFGFLREKAQKMGLRTVGELMAQTGDTREPRYSPNEFPEYQALLKSRQALLNRLSAEERAIYENESKSGSELQETYAAENAVRHFAEFAKDSLPLSAERMQRVAGSGPWSRYKMLDKSAGWDYRAYFRIVSRTPAHASVPCKIGLVPAWYVLMNGDMADLREILDLCPAAVRAADPSGRTILFDAMELAGRDEQISLLLTSGSDPDATTFAGHTPFGHAVRHMNFRAIEEMLQIGADPFLDSMLEKGAFLALAARPGCPGRLRFELQDIHDHFPERA